MHSFQNKTIFQIKPFKILKALVKRENIDIGEKSLKELIKINHEIRILLT